MVNLDHSECFQVECRILSLERGEQVCKIAEWQFSVEASDDVQFGSTFLDGLSGNTQRLDDIMCVSVCISRGAIKTAELTIGIANICRIEVPVNIKIRGAAMLLAPHYVSQFAQGREIIRCIKCQPIGEG